MNSIVVYDEHKEIIRLNVSGANLKVTCVSGVDLKVTWNVLRNKHKIKGDQGRPAKNPPMVKLVFFGIPIFVEVSE